MFKIEKLKSSKTLLTAKATYPVDKMDFEPSNRNDYSAKDITVLADLEAVRKRPGMYIGNVSTRGLHHLLWEVVDNSVDEALAGFCNNVKVILHQDGSASVEDNGRGIPVDLHETGKPALEVVMTKLHAGGKFGNKVYSVAGGLHGVGVSVVNALSEWLEVWVKRDGKIYYQRYERGEPKTELKILGESSESGTIVRFKPDEEIFEVTEFNYEIVSQRLKEIAYLCKGLRIVLLDERSGKIEEYKFDDGIVGLIKSLNKNKKVLHEPIYLENSKNGIMVEVALQFTDSEIENIQAFANNIKNQDGGTHVIGFRAGLTRAINEYGKKNVKKFETIAGAELREGLTAVISVKVPNPQFEGQTKSKLTNTEVKTSVESAVYSGMLKWLEDNPREAESLINRFLVIKRAREAARRAKELVKRKEELSITLPGKLADCSSKDVEEREIFIVEGESAGGSAKQARNRQFQAILPIRGKIINVEKAGMVKILKNEEIKAMISAIGAGIDKNFDLSKMRYSRVIIMSDADVDGLHIRTLLLAFFYRHMRPLIEAGRLYIAQPPLYGVKKGNKTYYAYNEAELNRLLEKLGNAEVQRYKGLGEMNPEQLWETTMDPQRRIMVQVKIEDAKRADELFRILMGEDVESRKNFIIAHSKEVKNLDV
ncbi:MAG: DNA topoisomerase (ATP-hydrolyzing) subunit B [Archaeoglobales archaeon]|nr:DNA topoisomerase (ATP-hydrolyzing) subunit B [Archaeoglobales archaeon]